MKAATPSEDIWGQILDISIHAAREGGDTGTICTELGYIISIHAAREGGDVCVGLFFNLAAPFQSTPPVKAATLPVDSVHTAAPFQSTPPVKAATQAHQRINGLENHFNPRRP